MPCTVDGVRRDLNYLSDLVIDTRAGEKGSYSSCESTDVHGYLDVVHIGEIGRRGPASTDFVLGDAEFFE